MESFDHSPYKKPRLLDRYFHALHRMKASDRFILKSILLACVIFGTLVLIQLSTNSAVRVATSGGTLSEGIIGTPRFVNPVLAVTRADRDLSTLIYDGLMTLGTDGVLIPNIAESVTISDDGLTYNVILRKDVKFHDTTPLTAHDVAFTVARIQDPLLASPLRANFEGVTVEEVGEYEMNFVLPEPYAPFIENLTFGILPQHIWKEASTEEFPFSQYNSEPIGSGPYMIKKIIRDTSGIPETYILTTNTEYHATTPKIETFEVHFYPTEEKIVQAFKKGIVQSIARVEYKNLEEYGIDPNTHHLERIPLPRTFALFINQNKSAALRDSGARKALDVALDRKALVDAVLGGYGNTLTSPIPPGFGIEIPPLAPDTPQGLDAARDILRAGGWKLNTEKNVWEKTIDGTLTPLSFSIATVNNSAFETTAEFLRETWTELGAEITIKQFEQSDLTQGIIRPRDYEALLFGIQLGRSLDYYSFWHSSQRNDPGLNIALYVNITTDSILAEMRRSGNVEEHDKAVLRFAEELKKETPAIFLYAPELLYIFPNSVTGASFTGIEESHERFRGVRNWYIETESIWPTFMK